MLEALSETLDDASNDPLVRAIVIAAEGPVFSAGHDLREMGGEDIESQLAHVN